MNQRSRIISGVLLAIWFLPLLANVSCAAISQDELVKMDQAMPAKPTRPPAQPRRMLVFNLCNGFKHGSIPYWDKALEIMGKKTGAFEVEISSDMSVFNAENLKGFDAVCLNNTTRLKFNESQRKSLMNFVKGGKGIVGIHAATDNFYDWPEAAKMMGGQFSGHPWGGGGTWAFKIDEPDHPLMKAFQGKGFKVKDEIYRTAAPFYSRAEQLVLMSLDMSDEATRKRAEKPGDMDTGISWIKDYGKGRVFYCSLGHNNEITWNPAILQHYLDGIQFALGDYQVDTKPRPVVSSAKESEMDQLLEKVKTYDWGQSRLPLTELSDKIREAYGSRAKLREIEKALIGVLEADATYAGKQWVCRKLSIIGTQQCVPTLSKMLVDEKLSDMARYALERIPGDAVDVALIANLNKAKGKARIGIVNTLGERRCPVAAPMIAKLVDNQDELLACASAAALGKIGGSVATETLAKAKANTSGKLRMVVLDAYLKCADKLVAGGKKKQANAIYKELYDPDMPAIIRVAALKGLTGVK
jgi:type 1 glutamine amidotransferase